MPKAAHNRSWWLTLPGVLTAVAGLITAVTGLLLALSEGGVISHKKEQGMGGAGPAPEQRPPAPPPRAPSPSEGRRLDGRVLRISRTENQIKIEFGVINNGDTQLILGADDIRLWQQDLPLAPIGGDLSGDEKLTVAAHGAQVTNSIFTASPEPGTRMALQIGKAGQQVRVPVIAPE